MTFKKNKTYFRHTFFQYIRRYTPNSFPQWCDSDPPDSSEDKVWNMKNQELHSLVLAFKRKGTFLMVIEIPFKHKDFNEIARTIKQSTRKSKTLTSLSFIFIRFVLKYIVHQYKSKDSNKKFEFKFFMEYLPIYILKDIFECSKWIRKVDAFLKHCLLKYSHDDLWLSKAPKWNGSHTFFLLKKNPV